MTAFRHEAKSAVFWSGVDIFLRQGLGFAIAIVLARLLVPEDFGTIALLALVMGIGNLFVNAGFSAALIQNQDVTHVDESTVFWFNIGAGLLITVIIVVFAPLIAQFFAVPVLEHLTMFMACNVFISATGSIHSTLMVKRLDFKTPMKIGVASTLISGSVGIYMAWADYGVWALAGQMIVGTVVGTILLWLLSSWRPTFTFSLDSFRRLFGFSSFIFVAALLQTIYRHSFALMIGKFYGVRDLGFYNRADSTQQLASGMVIGIVSRVTFPLYSALNHDVNKLRRAVRLSIRSIMLVTAPLMFGLAVLSEQFIPIVFGEQWEPAIPVLQALCFVGLLLPIQSANVSVLKAQGHAALNLRLNVIKKITGITFLIFGSFYGIMGIALSCTIQSFVALFINGHYTNKFLGYSMREQILDCFPNIMLSILMAVLLVVADHLFYMGGVVELTLLIIIGAGFYLASNVLLDMGAFNEAIRFMKGHEAF